MFKRIGYLVVLIAVGAVFYCSDEKNYVPYVTMLINWYILYELISISEELKK